VAGGVVAQANLKPLYLGLAASYAQLGKMEEAGQIASGDWPPMESGQTDLQCAP
jgi:hypothetical protein